MNEQVVNILKEPCTLYIGRPSKWGNPFRIGRDGTREEVLQKYENHVRASPKLLASLSQLQGQTLGCYCKPKACHGDILLKLLYEKTLASIA